MAGRPFRGVFVILATPFSDDGSLDEDGLKSVVEFSIAAGAHGLVTPANASEFSALSDPERLRVIEVVGRTARGRLPFVAGVSGVSSPGGCVAGETCGRRRRRRRDRHATLCVQACGRWREGVLRSDLPDDRTADIRTELSAADRRAVVIRVVGSACARDRTGALRQGGSPAGHALPFPRISLPAGNRSRACSGVRPDDS